MNDDEGLMLISRWFWIGGVLAWCAVYLLGWLLSKVPM